MNTILEEHEKADLIRSAFFIHLAPNDLESNPESRIQIKDIIL